MTEPAGASAPPSAADRCITCGYALAGLRPEAFCPECGTPARYSQPGGWMLDQPPPYVARLARGAASVRLGLAVAGLGVLGLVALALLLWMFLTPLFSPRTGFSGDVAGVFVGIGAMIVLVASICIQGIGWTDLTARPDDTAMRGRLRSRTLARASAYAAGGLLVCGPLSLVYAWSFPSWTWIVLVAAPVTALVLVTAHLAAAMQYTASLAGCVGDGRLAALARGHRLWAPLLFLGGVILCGPFAIIGIVLYYSTLGVLLRDLRWTLKRMAEGSPHPVAE